MLGCDSALAIPIKYAHNTAHFQLYTASDVFQTLFLDKFHGWTGGASALAVIIVGLALFVIARRYIKWRITAAYIGATVVMSLIMFAIYGGDPALRLMFELFIGSSIFLAFFMATDPATTPLTYTGQIIFGVGCSCHNSATADLR